ncbi:phosphoribosylformylglycinamidine synthase [Methanomicrobium sp. W14]|jgi:phosphoribosylformylglycinamidine synthase PurS subunit|uniref:phosphoribosylformylglycinamidine synthase subunit PurS n=1 Tax=Methanomicrobium sp. W14 TaxID=2817839 RepID=UPI001AE9F1F5|nr:phosphoribosylformylglycinamidine synthase subunit PurS [Methanomicrobium sp. W14]MBP2133924.1 phosphoribosylformylglycinamidine synthase [Methanomicrobium sp. W14]
MNFEVRIMISLKSGMLNPEARAIQHALSDLGFETESLRTSRVFDIGIEAENEQEAKKQAEEMCVRLLANPVIHSYSVEVKQL